MPVDQLDGAELRRLYGPWSGETPAGAAAFFVDYPGRWWVAGGWAVGAFTGVSRPHDDLDVEILRSDLPLLRKHIAGRLDVWSAASGSLRPLLPGDDAAGSADEVLPADCGQLWLRPGGSEPWVYDVLLTDGDDQTWICKRDRRVRRRLDDVLWTSGGITYLRPEVQLLLKASGNRLRAKDQADFDAAVPLLDRASLAWFRDTLELVRPDHPWLRALVGATS